MAIFQATITLGAVSTGTIASGKSAGQKFSKSRVVLTKKDGSTRETTAMAFGPQRDSVAKLLRKGKTVTVTAVWDNRILKVLGPRRAAPAAAEG